MRGEAVSKLGTPLSFPLRTHRLVNSEQRLAPCMTIADVDVLVEST